MTIPTAVPPPRPTTEPVRRWPVDEMVLVALVALSGIGVAVNQWSPESGLRYWLAMAPTFGVVSAAAAWASARDRGVPTMPVLARQVLHWLGTCGAIYLAFVLQAAGRMPQEAAGLIALAMLALATFLAGVHGSWRLVVVGLVLAVAVVAFAVVQRWVWVVAAALAIVAVVAAILASRRATAPPTV